MGFKSLALTAACAIILSVAAAPTENRISGPYGYSFDEVTEANRMYDNILAAQTGCEGQSCIIADLAGSTGRKIKERPEGGGKKDFSCIGKYNPKGMEDVMKVPNVQKQPTGLSSSLLGGMNSIQGYFPSKVDTGTFKGACKPNILFFARGTTEPELTSALGITVGPKLNSGLGGVMGSRDWLIQGIFYGADVPGDYCLGLAGGMVAKDLINQAAQKCPDAKIFVSGYSQGAMVAHNGVAYAEPLAKKRVAVSSETALRVLHLLINVRVLSHSEIHSKVLLSKVIKDRSLHSVILETEVSNLATLERTGSV